METGGGLTSTARFRDVLLRMDKETEVLKPKNAPEGELGVTLEEMIELTGLSKEEFQDVYLSWVEGMLFHRLPYQDGR